MFKEKTMSKKKILINGELVYSLSNQFSKVINPATEEVIAEVPICTGEDVKRAVEAAVSAEKTWGEKTPGERSEALLAFANAIEEHKEELAAIDSENVGKPLLNAIDEIDGLIDNMRFFAGAARTLQGSATGEYIKDHTSMIRRDPLGVVAAITPWNYPLPIAGWKLGPALAAGNTIVLKPSEVTPLSTLRLAEISMDIFPKGTINIVTGFGAETGSAMAKHPNISMIALTGSVRAGQAVTRDSADTLKKVHLELGGKAPVIIHDDANIDDVVEGVRMAGFYNTGQDCTAGTRLYVAEKIYDEFIEKFVPAVKSLKVGCPSDSDTEIGPLVSKEHFERVSNLVERAKKLPHVNVLAGGSAIEGTGYYYEPTIITGTKQDDEIIQEEVFGPVVTVMPFKDDNEAIELANDCKYGLAASVWTSDINRAMKSLKYLNFGTVWVNQHFLLISEMPHGGSKLSGGGNDQSIYSVEEFTQVRHAMVKFS